MTYPIVFLLFNKLHELIRIGNTDDLHAKCKTDSHTDAHGWNKIRTSNTFDPGDAPPRIEDTTSIVRLLLQLWSSRCPQMRFMRARDEAVVTSEEARGRERVNADLNPWADEIPSAKSKPTSPKKKEYIILVLLKCIHTLCIYVCYYSFVMVHFYVGQN
jgi:hypothetical protein